MERTLHHQNTSLKFSRPVRFAYSQQPPCQMDALPPGGLCRIFGIVWHVEHEKPKYLIRYKQCVENKYLHTCFECIWIRLYYY